MNVAVSVGFVFLAIVGACLFVLWFGSSVVIDQLEDRIDALEARWDDSPEAEEQNAAEEASAQVNVEEPKPDDCPTDEIPIAPPTVPDGIPLQVQSALIEQRPSPVPRKSADWVEEAIKGFNFSGRDR